MELTIWKGNIFIVKRSLDGLKQAPDTCFDRFTNVMFKQNFKSCYSNIDVSIRNICEGIIVLLLSLDDTIITKSDVKEIKQVKSFLKNE